ncbi:MAG: hypothetical protein PHU75_11505 [Candidatus Nanopelagicales bacterium]|nr:hypothetical protein [Candidatus Nanopelagicales bacterium]
MTRPDLFIGVVSHRGSRFAVSQGPQGLAALLEAELATAGIATTVVVSTDDHFDASPFPLSEASVQASLSAQLRLHGTWARFIGRRWSPRWLAEQALRSGKRQTQRVRSPGVAMLRRLLNIELSHVDLMRRGLASGAAWVLIIEDDGAASDVADCAAGLRGLMEHADRIAYANVSQSYSSRTLGVDHLLHADPGVRWAGTVSRGLFAADRPVTNTVCAILYAREFLPGLVRVMDELPMEPVVPIDWKLNLAMMRLFDEGAFAERRCWQVEPAPIDQLSMR